MLSLCACHDHCAVCCFACKLCYASYGWAGKCAAAACTVCCLHCLSPAATAVTHPHMNPGLSWSSGSPATTKEHVGSNICKHQCAGHSCVAGAGQPARAAWSCSAEQAKRLTQLHALAVLLPASWRMSLQRQLQAMANIHDASAGLWCARAALQL